jgi:hypothetical protein
MINAALVPFDSRATPMTLDMIEAHLGKTIPYRCTRTEWVGYSLTIPQLRVETPVPLTIQIEDDPEYVPEELAEMADEAEGEAILAAEQIVFLRRATGRLGVQSADYEGNSEVDSSGNIIVHARTDLDPSFPEIQEVLHALSALSRGPVLDCVNDRWLHWNEAA